MDYADVLLFAISDSLASWPRAFNEMGFAP
jgi:hypothetical protein